jgi:hypothetical protein
VETAELAQRTSGLVDAWCERRSLRALRAILAGWPTSLMLTDGWALLGDALRDVRAIARDELTTDEAQSVDELIAAVDIAMAR